ncbi:type II toxin-antitoxin system HicB family antitoxin [Geminicoccus harenae]|uniref:type II toxin-antitoxin system HicB family antitoxin n=1 Tax=Geminicoccus harenae TaxID=2498453 RepID=UPI00168AF770|nr:type II toxin-antitoxin system HicB family antitoxin [Geminicoccus harenae]
MKNIMEVDGQKAVVSFDPEIGLFRGEFLGLTGGADFYADSVAKLMEEARISLQTYLEECRARDIEAFRSYSGRFNLRIDPQLHEAVAAAAAAAQQSMNDWLASRIERAVKEEA